MSKGNVEATQKPHTWLDREVGGWGRRVNRHRHPESDLCGGMCWEGSFGSAAPPPCTPRGLQNGTVTGVGVPGSWSLGPPAPAGQIPAPRSALERSGVQWPWGGSEVCGWGGRLPQGDPACLRTSSPRSPQKPGRRWGAVRGAQGCGARSEGKAALGGVSHTLQVGQAGILDHGRRPAHQHQRLLLGRRQVCPDHVLIHEALAVVPGCRHKRGQVSTPAASPPQGRGRSLHSLTHSLNRSGN